MEKHLRHLLFRRIYGSVSFRNRQMLLRVDNVTFKICDCRTDDTSRFYQQLETWGSSIIQHPFKRLNVTLTTEWTCFYFSSGLFSDSFSSQLSRLETRWLLMVGDVADVCIKRSVWFLKRWGKETRFMSRSNDPLGVNILQLQSDAEDTCDTINSTVCAGLKHEHVETYSSSAAAEDEWS